MILEVKRVHEVKEDKNETSETDLKFIFMNNIKFQNYQIKIQKRIGIASIEILNK